MLFTSYCPFVSVFVSDCSKRIQFAGAMIALTLKMLAQSFVITREIKMSLSANSDAVTYAKSANAKTAAETGDRIEWVKLSWLSFLWQHP